MVRKVFEIRVFKVMYATVAWSGLRGLRDIHGGKKGQKIPIKGEGNEEEGRNEEG